MVNNKELQQNYLSQFAEVPDQRKAVWQAKGERKTEGEDKIRIRR